jgi:hypothetical protein
VTYEARGLLHGLAEILFKPEHWQDDDPTERKITPGLIRWMLAPLAVGNRQPIAVHEIVNDGASAMHGGFCVIYAISDRPCAP